MDWLPIVVIPVIITFRILLAVYSGSKYRYYKRLDKWRKKKWSDWGWL